MLISVQSVDKIQRLFNVKRGDHQFVWQRHIVCKIKALLSYLGDVTSYSLRRLKLGEDLHTFSRKVRCFICRKCTERWERMIYYCAEHLPVDPAICLLICSAVTCPQVQEKARRGELFC